MLIGTPQKFLPIILPSAPAFMTILVVVAIAFPGSSETATEDEFLKWSKEKMAGYKRPKEVVFVDSLPLTSVGKVLRRELRDAELKKMGK